MRIKLLSLVLQCRGGQEVIDFSPVITFFHGKMSAGKSSIARLIDYCLGAKEVERTTAIRKELVSVELTAEIGSFRVVFGRTAEPTGSVEVSWTDSQNQTYNALAPLQEAENQSPLVGDNVFTLSDLIFYFFGKEPLRVRKSTLNDDSPMIRLSFRDIFWYCYLDQNRLDNSFFRLHETYVQTKSRYAIRYVLGYYTERLEELQGQLKQAIDGRTEKLGAAHQAREFLQELGYSSESEIQADITEMARQLEGARAHQSELQTSFHADTHFADELRDRLRALSGSLGQEQQSLADLRERREELAALKNELITTKQKLSRASAGATVLSGVAFEMCPQCGTKVQPVASNVSSCCSLCGKVPPKADETRASQYQAARRDIDNRLREIDESLTRSAKAVKNQERRVESLRKEKQELDIRLADELQRYDSAFLAQAREADRRVATLEERVRGLDRFRKLPDIIERLEREASSLLAEQDRLRRAIQEEQQNLLSTDRLISELEAEYLKMLLAVGVPGVKHGDRVELNRKTWIPDILEGGDEAQRWNFYSAGSNGKKTLLNVCYALSVHVIAEAYDRPLPSLLMIDHPMKCTSPDVNRDVFEAFYKTVYQLVKGPLRRTQLVLIDNDFFPPDGSVNVVERYMTPDEEDHPPLISYYRGA